MLVSWWIPLTAKVGATPSVVLLADATGEPATRELRRCAIQLLERHFGLVQIDSSEESWTSLGTIFAPVPFTKDLAWKSGTDGQIRKPNNQLGSHSRAMFDMGKNITYRGVVEEYRWQNPHSHIVVKSRGPRQQRRTGCVVIDLSRSACSQSPCARAPAENALEVSTTVDDPVELEGISHVIESCKFATPLGVCQQRDRHSPPHDTRRMPIHRHWRDCSLRDAIGFANRHGQVI